jgi:hypothetical protein
VVFKEIFLQKMIEAFLNKSKEIELKKVKIPELKVGEVRIKLKNIIIGFLLSQLFAIFAILLTWKL